MLGEKWKKWKTTVVGIIMSILGVLFMLGILTPEQKQVLDETAAELADKSDQIHEIVLGLIGLISGVINVFRAD